MSITLYGIRNCDTIKQARGWLDGRGIDYAFHDYKIAGIDAERLGRWADVAGWQVLLNRAGTTFRKLDDTDKVDLDRDQAIALMMRQPSMIKRPVLDYDGGVTIGFEPEIYASMLA